MGHDHHFLSRLDRASEQHIELALSLYRDADLTKYLVATASLATPTKSGSAHRGERIAVSLERDEGPYVILTADGHFVTCLARGMTPGTLPVFSRAWLDRTIDAHARLRQGIARARERTAEASDTGGLLRGLWARAHAFTREEFVAIRGLAELFGPLWPGAMRQGVGGIARTLSGLTTALQRGEPAVLDEAGYDRYWKAAWGASHFAVLTGCAGEVVGRQFVEEWPLAQSPTVLLWMPNIHILQVRAAWFAAQHGEVLLPLYDRELDGPVEDRILRDVISSLMAMAIRWPSLRKPVLRIFAERRPSGLFQDFYDAYVDLAKEFIDDPRTSDTVVMTYGRAFVDSLWKQTGRPGRATDELAMGYGVVHPFDLANGLDNVKMEEGERMTLCMAAIARAARHDAEELFLPEVHHPRFGPETIAQVMRVNIRRYAEDRLAPLGRKTRAPVVRRPEEKLGRNEKCPCGSGKKVKKCCGGEPRSGVQANGQAGSGLRRVAR